MARFSPKARDCLHSCMPGPVDTWVRLVYNLLLSQGGRWADAPSAGRRFFAADRQAWLERRGTAERLERELPCAACEAKLRHLPWWPFRRLARPDNGTQGSAEAAGPAGESEASELQTGQL